MKIRSLLLSLVLLAAANHAVAQSGNAASETPLAETAAITAPPLPVRELGSSDAPVRIDLYMTFSCGDCAEWYLSVLPELKRDYIDPGRVRLVFHDVVTVPAQPSVRSAMIGLCAAPGRFFDVAEAFAGGLRAASEDVEMVAPWYENATAASGLTPEEMEDCANSEPIYEQVRAQMQDPVVATLKQLPGVLVNGELLETSDIERVRAAIIFVLPAA